MKLVRNLADLNLFAELPARFRKSFTIEVLDERYYTGTASKRSLTLPLLSPNESM